MMIVMLLTRMRTTSTAVMIVIYDSGINDDEDGIDYCSNVEKHDDDGDGEYEDGVNVSWISLFYKTTPSSS